MMQKHKLSKSTFTYGKQCLKRLFLHKYHGKLGVIRDPISMAQQTRFASGTELGKLAQQKFPGGIDCTPAYPYSYSESLLQTEIVINAQQPCIVYEAAFQTSNGVLCAVDILTGSKRPGTNTDTTEPILWDAYEVKSTQSTKEQHIIDAALQYWVMSKCGLPLNSINILHMNRDYKLKPPVGSSASCKLDTDELFVVDNVTERVLQMQSSISEQVEQQLQLLQLGTNANAVGAELVDIEDVLSHSCFKSSCRGQDAGATGAALPAAVSDILIGEQCSTPYPCDFIGHCFGRVFGPGVGDGSGDGDGGYDSRKSILNLTRGGEKKWTFLHDYDIKRTTEVPAARLKELSASQQVQVRADISGEEIVRPAELRRLLDSLEYPLYYLDFETIMPAVPLFPDTGCFETLCVQYSLHIQPQPFSGDYICKAASDGTHPSPIAASDGTHPSPIVHAEYLADHTCRTDPTVSFMDRLIADLRVDTTDPGDSGAEGAAAAGGSIIVYSSFEASRLKAIAAKFPQYTAAVDSICARIVDLAVPFQKKHWYLPELDGKYSIKKVYPAVVPEDRGAYAKLQIQEGLTATTAFLDVVTAHVGHQEFQPSPPVPVDSQGDVAVVRRNLLEYCRLDTWAMVRILESMARKAAEAEGSAAIPRPPKKRVIAVKTKKFSVLERV